MVPRERTAAGAPPCRFCSAQAARPPGPKNRPAVSSTRELAGELNDASYSDVLRMAIRMFRTPPGAAVFCALSTRVGSSIVDLCSNGVLNLDRSTLKSAGLKSPLLNSGLKRSVNAWIDGSHYLEAADRSIPPNDRLNSRTARMHTRAV